MATKQKINFDEWAAAQYAREVKGNVVGSEFNNGVPLEIPVEFTRPETLDQQIMRLVKAYSRDTGQEFETIEEANDFSIPGEDEDYEEDDYIADALRQRNDPGQTVAGDNPSPDQSGSGEATRQAATPAASVVPSAPTPADSGVKS